MNQIVPDEGNNTESISVRPCSELVRKSNRNLTKQLLHRHYTIRLLDYMLLLFGINPQKSCLSHWWARIL